MTVIRDANIINRKESFSFPYGNKNGKHAFFIKNHSRAVMNRLIFLFFALYYSRTVMKNSMEMIYGT